MKSSFTFRTLLVFLFSLSLSYSYAQNTWTNGNGTGVWSDDANWSSAAAPDGSENVVFDGATTTADCFIDVAVAIAPATITFNSTYTGTVSVASGISVDLGTMTINRGSFVMGDNTFSCLGLFFLNTTNTRSFDGTSASQIQINGNLSYGSSASRNATFKAAANTTSGTILTGTFTYNGFGTFTHNNGLFKFSAASARTIPNGFTFYQLQIDNSGSGALTYTIGTTVTVTNKLIISGGNSCTSSFATGTINLGGGLDVSNFTSTNVGATLSATINFNGTTAQTITGTTSAGTASLPNITLNNTSAAVTLSSGNLNVGGNFTINSSNSFATSSNNLYIRGNFTNSGTFTPGSSTINCQGGSTQSLAFGAGATINTLTINKSAGTATLSDAISISSQLNPTLGTFNANGKLTLTSTSAGNSAQIGTVGGTLSGNYTVQRYITGLRAWRFLASPISQSFSSSWQNSIYITGAGTGGTICPSLTTNSNGFDATLANSPSVYTYNESTSAWVGLSATTSSIAPGVGYRVFVRGNRTQGCSQLDGTTYTPGAVTLSATGAFTNNTNFGDVTISVTKSGAGWNLVGNPYQATLDWTNSAWVTARGSNITNALYTINPSTGTYASYSSGVGVNGGSNYISPGQSFFINVTTATSLVFKEAYKNTAQTGAGLFKTGDIIPVLYAKFNDVGSTPIYDDETAIVFRPTATRGFDAQYDAISMSFATGSIRNYNSASASKYAINSIPTLQTAGTDTIYLEVAYPSSIGNYTLTFRKQDLPLGTSITLIDNFTSTATNLSSNLVYSFNTTSSSASTSTNRFMIIFTDNSTSLPVELAKFSADKSSNKDVKLSWSTSSEVNNNRFEVERSFDKVEFINIGQVKGHSNSSTINNYEMDDATPNLNAVNYYRLKQINFDGKFTYSPILSVDFNDNMNTLNAENMSVYPVPAINSVSVKLNSSYLGEVTINIYDQYGKIVSTREALVAKNNSDLSHNISNLNSGFYIIEVVSKSGEVAQKAKFIKE